MWLNGQLLVSSWERNRVLLRLNLWGYYENNADRCFTNLSGYKDNTLCGLVLSYFTPKASLRLYPNGRHETTLFGCRGEDHGDIEKVKM